MRKVIYLITALFMGVGIADAAVRGANSISRNDTSKNIVSRAPDNTQKNTTARATTKKTISRTATNIRNNAQTATPARSAKSVTTARAATNSRTVRAAKPTTARTATNNTVRSAIRPARATLTMNTTHSNTFGTGYNTCRDAYFTCMDQFCGTANDTYRRCICSSKLSEIQSRERALSNAADQLSDFNNLNMTVIDKTASEVTAMITATTGELTQSVSKDTSASASQLAGISAILAKTKNKSLSTQGTLDIAGNIDSIWSTSDLAGGTNIANLTGEALYNAVHAQCSQMVIDKCPDITTQNMVVSAYGMYIENDCSALINNLDKKLSNANGTIRASERDMNLARLENYNAHNSTPINDCIAQVRSDITADTACGMDYVHCLDITGRYLNYETGEPIYSPDFYQLESQISLSGDILTNETNRLLVAELNKKRDYAARGLDTCRDLADDVWDEFLRQAITEIYQGQHERIRNVKNECLDVVTNCYDEQSQSLKDFSNVKEQLLLGSRLELSEEMCREKLDACSNLYGGGSHGMDELLNAMYDITSQNIAKACLTTLHDFAKDLCAVPSNDSLHSYPFACRVYAPGEQRYAAIHACNIKTQNAKNSSNIDDSLAGGGNDDNDDSADTGNGQTNYNCPHLKTYSSCKEGYYLTYNGVYNRESQQGNKCSKCIANATCYEGTDAPKCKEGHFMKFNGQYTNDTSVAFECAKCPSNCECNGGIAEPQCREVTIDPDIVMCGTDYIGSLYHKLARYAMQACVRPSESNKALPATVLQDINVVMDQIRIDMSKSLADECDRLGGEWVDTIWVDDTPQDDTHDTTGDKLFKKFYSETSANTKWGYCAEKTTEKTTEETTTETPTPEQSDTQQ